MKNLFVIILVLLSFSVTAQKRDTLTVPVGKYKFIKVGDKVYKLVTTLEEVKQDQGIIFKSFDGTSNQLYQGYYPTYTTPATMNLSESDTNKLTK